jgi:hypothetical protein
METTTQKTHAELLASLSLYGISYEGKDLSCSNVRRTLLQQLRQASQYCLDKSITVAQYLEEQKQQPQKEVKAMTTTTTATPVKVATTTPVAAPKPMYSTASQHPHVETFVSRIVDDGEQLEFPTVAFGELVKGHQHQAIALMFCLLTNKIEHAYVVNHSLMAVERVSIERLEELTKVSRNDLLATNKPAKVAATAPATKAKKAKAAPAAPVDSDTLLVDVQALVETNGNLMSLKSKYNKLATAMGLPLSVSTDKKATVLELATTLLEKAGKTVTQPTLVEKAPAASKDGVLSTTDIKALAKKHSIDLSEFNFRSSKDRAKASDLVKQAAA